MWSVSVNNEDDETTICQYITTIPLLFGVFSNMSCINYTW